MYVCYMCTAHREKEQVGMRTQGGKILIVGKNLGEGGNRCSYSILSNFQCV